jgi:geranylgeranyl pyrophosphate synthase
LQEINDIITKYDGFKETYETARRYVDLAKEQLAVFRPSIEKDILLYTADYVLKRDR